MNTAVVYHRKISFTNENSIKHLNLKYEHRNIQNIGMSTIKKKLLHLWKLFCYVHLLVISSSHQELLCRDHEEKKCIIPK